MDPIMKWAIFPDFYAADTHKWLALNCEMCAKAQKEDFANIFRLQLEPLVDIIEFIIHNKLDDWELPKARTHFQMNMRPGCAMFIDKLIACRTTIKCSEAMKCIWSLIDFYRKNGLQSMLPGDVESPANWGLTMRNN